MPKKYKDLKNKKLSDSLTSQENHAVEDVETYIDNQIEAQWEGGFVLVDDCIVTFECDPTTHAPTSFSEGTRLIMKELLFSRYRDNDWKIFFSINGQWRFKPTKT